MNIVIIEDNHELREILVEQFKSFTKDVLAFESIEDFHKQRTKRDFKKLDAAIIDINLPGTNGLEYLKQYKSDHELPTLFVITGDAFIEANFDQLPEIYIFKKPLNMEMLISSVIATRNE
jgi:DNA-binding NtrC family response regulator